MIEQLRIRVLPDGRVSRADAARFLGFSAGTLANWASRGEGPAVKRVRGRAFYQFDELERFRDG